MNPVHLRIKEGMQFGQLVWDDRSKQLLSFGFTY